MNSISVTTLVRYLKNKLDSDSALSSLLVSGELSNFRKSPSGHLYFTLKDENCSISCVMFKSKAAYLNFNPKNGDKVLLQGSVSLFEASGQMQIYVNSLRLDGVGDLYAKYEELKNKLYSEGLFADDHKKDIPTKYPLKVAVLCGDNSAAMSDIKIQFKRRWPLCKVDYYPVIVQGLQASADIIEKLLKVDELNYEIIVLARGGGSFEDLFCFNDETLARTIYSLNTFIVSGVGHEQDFTLTDFVADLRAPTPTGAIELITPNIVDVNEEIDDLGAELNYLMENKITYIKDSLDSLANNKYLLNPKLLIDKTSLKLDYYLERINSFSNRLLSINKDIDNTVNNMVINLNIKLNKRQNDLDKLNSLLKAYSVDNTLKRGYSLVYKDNKLLKDEVNIDDDLLIETYLDKINVSVKKVSKKWPN